eukprot:RCo039211
MKTRNRNIFFSRFGAASGAVSASGTSSSSLGGTSLISTSCMAAIDSDLLLRLPLQMLSLCFQEKQRKRPHGWRKTFGAGKNRCEMCEKESGEVKIGQGSVARGERKKKPPQHRRVEKMIT